MDSKIYITTTNSSFHLNCNKGSEFPVIDFEDSEEPIVEITPLEESTPAEEPEVEEPAPIEEVPQEQLQVEEPAPVVEEPKPVEKVRKPRKTRVKKSKPKEKAPVKEPSKEEPVEKKKAPMPKDKLEKIPGKFIVKTNQGYYVNQRSYSIHKEEAKIFDDFNEANSVKKNHGGKVVKL